MSFFPIKVKSFEHIIKMFDLADKIVLVAKTSAGDIPMLVDKAGILEKEIGLRNAISAGMQLTIKGIKE